MHLRQKVGIAHDGPTNNGRPTNLVSPTESLYMHMHILRLRGGTGNVANGGPTNYIGPTNYTGPTNYIGPTNYSGPTNCSEPTNYVGPTNYIGPTNYGTESASVADADACDVIELGPGKSRHSV